METITTTRYFIVTTMVIINQFEITYISARAIMLLTIVSIIIIIAIIIN